MFIISYKVISYHLRYYNVQSWSKKIKFHIYEGYNNVLETKKTIIGVDMDQETSVSYS
jgi:hypothetical protein